MVGGSGLRTGTGGRWKWAEGDESAVSESLIFKEWD